MAYTMPPEEGLQEQMADRARQYFEQHYMQVSGVCWCLWKGDDTAVAQGVLRHLGAGASADRGL